MSLTWHTCAVMVLCVTQHTRSPRLNVEHRVLGELRVPIQSLGAMGQQQVFPIGRYGERCGRDCFLPKVIKNIN